MLENFMQQFQKDMDVADAFDKPTPDSYSIPFDKGFKIVITELPSGFSLFSEFNALPKSNEEAFYLKALTGNLFGKGTRGSSLGINDKENMLTISQVIDYNTEYKDFKEIIDDFITTIDFWKNELDSKVKI